ncbi:uncharacterized protein LOC132758900 [Ruditapes philippinarum]|uniref:uncharacterized protein LOC132758900 n=1 Tax=Ruditapes philippinarum TaxID=129788 RepID=UPI00295B524B|nr:uncharacterized protein LOC132758900 [Ruditapes philippinarum]
MTSIVLFETLYISSVFMIAIAALRCVSSSDYRIFSYILLFLYNIGLLLFVFFETLCFYTKKAKKEKRFRAHVDYEKCSRYLPFEAVLCVLIFLVVLCMREISYGELNTQNSISAIRCVAVLLYMIFFHYSKYQESRYTFYVFLLEFLLFVLLNQYLYKNDAHRSWTQAFIMLVILIFYPFTKQILKSVYSKSLNEINIIKQYAINSNPRKFRKHFLFAIENEFHFTNPTLAEKIKTILDENYVIGHSFVLIDNVELIKENLTSLQDDADIEECFELILRTVKKMDDVINAEISKHKNKVSSVVNSLNIKALEDTGFYIFFLTMVIQLFCLAVKHNEKRLEQQEDWSLFFDSKTVLYMLNGTQTDNFDSFICFYMQLVINYSRILGLLYTVLINIAVFIWQTTFKLIYDQFKLIWKITVFTMTLVINTFVFIFVLHTISVLGTQFIESSVKQLTNIQHNIETTRHPISSYNQTTETTISERYTGEDVLLHCSLSYNFREEWLKYKLLWTHNDIVIDEKSSDRVTIWTTYHDYFAESELKLVLIKNDDFGTFRCILHEVQYIPVVYTLLWNGQIASYVFEVILRDIYRTRKYELRHTEILNNTYEIAEGTLIVFDIFAYYSYADFEDLSFLYTVNDIEIHDLCTSDWLSCKPFAFIVKNFMESQFTRWRLSLYRDKVYEISLKFCACSKIFGVHKLFLYREYYNKTSGKTESKEIEYPIGFLFLPKGNDTGIRKELFINNTREFISQYLEISDQIVIPMLFGRTLRISVYSSFNFITFLLFVLVVIYVLKMVNHVIHLYCCLTIIPVRNILLFGSIRQPVPQIENRHFAGILPCRETVYDAYISNSENDNAFIEYVILPYIEQECRNTVCFPPRDLAHEAGASLHLYMKATEQSRQFIVVLSHSYLEDNNCNRLQLLTCILPLLAERNGEENILLVIKLEQVDLPVQINRNPRISVLDWTSCNDERYKLRKIKRFLSVLENSYY